MMSLMSLFALVMGLLVGFGCYRRERLGWLFTIYHTASFRSKSAFYNVYDLADDEITYDWYKEHNDNIKSYADYLRIHALARDSAYKTFAGLLRSIRIIMLEKVVPVSVLPALLFWSNWYFYLIGVALAVIFLVTFEVAKNGFRPGFYQRVIIFTVLNNYKREKAKKA